MFYYVISCSESDKAEYLGQYVSYLVRLPLKQLVQKVWLRWKIDRVCAKMEQMFPRPTWNHGWDVKNKEAVDSFHVEADAWLEKWKPYYEQNVDPLVERFYRGLPEDNYFFVSPKPKRGVVFLNQKDLLLEQANTPYFPEEQNAEVETVSV